MARTVSCASRGSPVSDDGRGLKQAHHQVGQAHRVGSPVSDDGRGLKHRVAHALAHRALGSPVSDDGRGLKRLQGKVVRTELTVRPSAMTGAD